MGCFMAKVLRCLVKVAAAGCVAFALLCAFSFVYYNPNSHLPASDGATDYIREPNRFYSYMTEGYSLGRADRNGFNNPGDMEDNSQSPNILVMGSSHIEAMYVLQSQSFPFQLNQMLKAEGKTVYNIAMSAHQLERCISNLESALEVYAPKDYVVIETMAITFAPDDMEALLSGTMAKLTSYDTGNWQYWIQQPPYIKLLYNQLRSIQKSEQVAVTTAPKVSGQAEYQALVEKMVRLLSDTCQKYHVEPIVCFHPRLILQQDGSAIPDYSADDCALFAEACKRQDVIFVDMTDTFLRNYNEMHVLPHGFPNTELGTGHLNSDGQYMIAEEIYRVISDRLPVE